MIIAALCMLALAGCESVEGTLGLGVLGATYLGGQSPDHEIEQLYYLGVFDPQDQLPPMIYRVRVHGQASFLSRTNFATGWVPAQVVDSLGSGIQLDKEKNSFVVKKGEAELAKLETGRRLTLFGPEGFRDAPKDHRLVVVMASDPSEFFSAVDQSLGAVNTARADQREASLNRALFEALSRTKAESDSLVDLILDVQSAMPDQAGGKS